MGSAESKFYHPNIIWFGVWLAFFLIIAITGSWQNHLYWIDNQNRFTNLESATVQKVLPYAVACLEEQGRPDLLQQIVDTDLGPYAIILTDGDRKIKYAPEALWGKIDSDYLRNLKFLCIYKDLHLETVSGPGYTCQGDNNPGVLGRVYLISKHRPGFMETLGQASAKLRNPSDSVLAFTLLSYILVLVGFAGICAITAKFQSYFQDVQEKQYEAELESRELRIEVLESNIKSADLRLQLLDQSQEKAQSIMNAAKGTIAELESALDYESSRNEELREKFQQAEAARYEAAEAILAIELDREKISKELKELEAMREVEEMNYPDSAKEKARRPKEFQWLNMVYKNLSFSRRALQNIIELQNSSDVFPSLPDALASLNGSSVESLLDGSALPSRSVVRYTQPLACYDGELWEYRFSKDGRLFFGLSKARTWNIDTILLKRKFSLNRHKYEKYLEQTLGKDNNDLQAELTTPNYRESQG